MAAVLSNTTDCYFSTPIECEALVRGGKLVALGTSSLTRSPGLPDVPTLNESGLPGFELTSYASVMIKSGTSPAIITKLSDAIMRTIRMPEVRETIAQNGDVPSGTLAEATELHAKEHQRWSRAVKAMNVKPG